MTKQELIQKLEAIGIKQTKKDVNLFLEQGDHIEAFELLEGVVDKVLAVIKEAKKS